MYLKAENSLFLWWISNDAPSSGDLRINLPVATGSLPPVPLGPWYNPGRPASVFTCLAKPCLPFQSLSLLQLRTCELHPSRSNFCRLLVIPAESNFPFSVTAPCGFYHSDLFVSVLPSELQQISHKGTHFSYHQCPTPSWCPNSQTNVLISLTPVSTGEFAPFSFKSEPQNGKTFATS